MISLPIKVQTLGREASFCPASYQKLGFHRQIQLVDVLCLVYTREEYGEVEASMIAPLPDEAQGSLPSHVDWRSLVKIWNSFDRRYHSRGLALAQRWEANKPICLAPVDRLPLAHLIAPSLRRLLHALLFDTFHADGVSLFLQHLTSIIPLIPL